MLYTVKLTFLYVFFFYSDYFGFILQLAKNVEERNIPWSQQVDEAASYENLASPINEENSSGKTNHSTILLVVRLYAIYF